MTESSPVRISLAELIALRGQLPKSLRPPSRALAGGSGGYLTRVRGRGMEFSEVRSYQAGDDIRSIDWRVTARRGKPHTKLFQEERERPTLLALDYRRPMFFATRGSFKAVQASHLAALFAWQALQRGDRLGAFIFSEERHLELRPRPGKGAVLNLLRQMVADPVWQRPPHAPFQPQQRLAATLQRLRRVVRPGSLIQLLSDFSQWDRLVEKELTLLRRSCDLDLIYCYDQLEQELPPPGAYRVSDGHGDLTISTATPTIRRDYRRAFERQQQQLESFARARGCRLQLLATDRPPLELLQRLAIRGGA